MSSPSSFAPDPSELTDIADRIRATFERLVRQLRRHGLGEMTYTELSVLGAVHRHGPIRPSDLATLEHVSRPTIAAAIGSLERKGMVRRTRDDLDGRVSLVRTTADGEAWIENTRGQRNEWLARRLASRPRRDRELLLAMLPALERLMSDTDDA